jgi:sugar phosphate isomerase/epimerase
MHRPLSRRQALQLAAASFACAAIPARGSLPLAAGRKFTIDLTPGAIGVQAGYPQLVELAARHGFESIAPDPAYLATLSDAERADLLASMKSKNLTFGAAGLPVEFRRDEETFRKGLELLPAAALALQKAGATRVGTYIMPNSDELTYLANFQRHADRLREVARILGDHGLRFGLEYVGPKTLWTARKYPFLHTLAETRELIAAIDRPNVGLVLDSWHWYTAGETVEDLKTLTNDDVVACDLNDAPAGLPVDQQIDSRRELPAATGVIDLKSFLETLVSIGYDGPVRAEPFNAPLNALDNDAALATTSAALRKAIDLLN